MNMHLRTHAHAQKSTNKTMAHVCMQDYASKFMAHVDVCILERDEDGTRMGWGTYG